MNKIISLKLNTQFKKLYSKGKSAVRPTLVMYARRNGLPFCRLGITVGKKLGCAVIRNRSKRRLRELFRQHADGLRPGFDLVLVARGRTVSAPFAKIENDFLSAAAETEVLKNEKNS